MVLAALALLVTAQTLDGRAVQILPTSATRGVICFFVLDGCPNANAYAPEMSRIAREYRSKGWQSYLVYGDLGADSATLKRHYAAFGFGFPAVRAAKALSQVAHATMSPEAAVLSRSGDLLYHGRIDDRFYALGRFRPSPTTHDLRAALDAIDAGKPPPKKATPVVGCYLPT